MLDVHVALAKTAKYRMAESGDTFEMIERPEGGFSFVIADGQGNGRGAKILSNLVVTRTMTLLKDGLQDEAAAQSVNNYLYNYRQGQVGVSLDILSVELARSNLRLIRHNSCPCFVIDAEGVHAQEPLDNLIGLQDVIMPQLIDIPVQPYTYVVLCTSGIFRCGTASGVPFNPLVYLRTWQTDAGRTPEALVEGLLQYALDAEQGELSDDVTILGLALLPAAEGPKVRRILGHLPFSPA